MTGKYAGKDVFISRIPLSPSGMDLPISFQQLQLPAKLSFAMTINKAQGQSLKIVGLQLDEPVFAHGQLYVGCSRVGNPNNLYMLLNEEKNKKM